MISIEYITKFFGKQEALKNINLQLKPGHSYALLGPNGSGKTTLIKSILGMVKPSQGNITVMGLPIDGKHEYRRHIGYMPQISRYPDYLTIGQLLKMIKSLRPANIECDEELIESFHLKEMYEKRMFSLSGGTRQKIGAAIAFLFKPQIYILDEPTAGLDPMAAEILKAKIQKETNEGKLVLITSHILSDLEELCTDIIYLQDGNICYESSLKDLQKSTGEIKLGKAINSILKWQDNQIKELVKS
jgi:Cu-processing system ATP-binding protein